MKMISSLQNPLVKEAASLHQKKYRDETGLFLIEGEEFCRHAIAQGWECTLLFVHDAHDTDILDAQDYAHVPMHILEKISKKENAQPVLGMFRQRVSNMPQDASFFLALEHVRDPGNLGTILRTAHAVGLTQLILIGQSCDPFSPEVIRASMGSFSRVALVPMTPDDFVAWATVKKLAVLGTDVADASDFRQTAYQNAVVVMGNEQKGLSADLKARCTGRIHIPMPGGTESLNLAVASALVLYQAQLAG